MDNTGTMCNTMIRFRIRLRPTKDILIKESRSSNKTEKISIDPIQKSYANEYQFHVVIFFSSKENHSSHEFY